MGLIDPDDPIRMDLLVRLGEAEHRAGDPHALETLERGATLARSAGADRVGRLVRLAREATPAGTIATVDAGQHGACVAAGKRTFTLTSKRALRKGQTVSITVQARDADGDVTTRRITAKVR